ncbi:PREDICTED: uncharacterized protein LOC109242634 [Nicotiana attenuata]|uniref:uncharacterized protein LOC109242634 n=1 Tax=Nicotiana attenuata TaxID=49451 RepID=UPI0009050079|nr:PREDICTED: uncharacterized protein LOC109242634 [Nicotiana attenuata]
MEYLNRLLKTLRSNPDFNFHPRCDKLQIIQLGFADDLLMFCRGKASGLRANLDKSSVYFGGVGKDTQLEILNVLGFTKGELPIRYLGVSLSTKRLSVMQCYPLVDKMLGLGSSLSLCTTGADKLPFTIQNGLLERSKPGTGGIIPRSRGHLSRSKKMDPK